MTYAPVVSANRRTWQFRLPPSWPLLAGLLATLAWWACSGTVSESAPPQMEMDEDVWLIAPWCAGTTCNDLKLRIESALIKPSCTDNIERDDFLCVQMGTASKPASDSDPFMKIRVQNVYNGSVEFADLSYPADPLTSFRAFLLKKGDIQTPSPYICPPGTQYGRVNWSWHGTGPAPLNTLGVGATTELRLAPGGNVSINVKTDARAPRSILTDRPIVRTPLPEGYEQLTLTDWDICDQSTVELSAQPESGEHVIWHEGLDCEKGSITSRGEKQPLSFWPSVPFSALPSACAYYYTGCLEDPTIDSCNPATCAGGPSLQVKCDQERCKLNTETHEAAPGPKNVSLMVVPTPLASTPSVASLKQAICAHTTAMPGSGTPNLANCQTAKIVPSDLLVPPVFSYEVEVKGHRISMQSMDQGHGCSYVPGSRTASVDTDSSKVPIVQLGNGTATSFSGTNFTVSGFVNSASNQCAPLQLDLMTWNLDVQDQLVIDTVNILRAEAR